MQRRDDVDHRVLKLTSFATALQIASMCRGAEIEMLIRSYVVRFDSGFAPNPFGGDPDTRDLQTSDPKTCFER